MLPEEDAECLLYLAYGAYLNAEAGGVEALHVVLGDDNLLEAYLLGLGNALLDAAYGTYFAGEAYLTCHAYGGLNLGVHVTR